MTPEEDDADRKARRQMGSHGHLFVVAMILLVLTLLSWLARYFPAP